jgi:two-component system chemotaxis response regulator CheY
MSKKDGVDRSHNDTGIVDERQASMSKTVLIVDDSSIMRKIIKHWLKTDGHTVVGEAKNGVDAVEMYKQLKPDWVTMDITMRGMDGLQAAKKIIQFDSCAQIIFLSNLDEEKYSNSVMQLGARGYVGKHNLKVVLQMIRGIH